MIDPIDRFGQRAGVEAQSVRPALDPAHHNPGFCLEIAGLDTPRPAVASPTVAGPLDNRSTITRRMGWASALKASLTIVLTLSPQGDRDDGPGRRRFR